MSSYDAYHPSGAVLPAILQRKLKQEGIDEQQRPSLDEGDDDTEISRRIDSGRIWTATSIEQRLQETAIALQNIQKQIARGEECYVDEAAQHNIYKGWEGFIDCREGTNSSSSGGVMMGPPRRMQSDNRWFSNSFDTATGNSIVKSYAPMGEYVPEPNAPKTIQRRSDQSKKRKVPEKSTTNAVTTTTPEKNTDEPAEKRAKVLSPPSAASTQETPSRSITRPKRKRKAVL